MSSEQFKMTVLLLIVVAVLGVLLWRPWRVRRDQRRSGDRDRRRDGKDRR